MWLMVRFISLISNAYFNIAHAPRKSSVFFVTAVLRRSDRCRAAGGRDLRPFRSGRGGETAKAIRARRACGGLLPSWGGGRMPGEALVGGAAACLRRRRGSRSGAPPAAGAGRGVQAGACGGAPGAGAWGAA